ncbi:MAG: hypothetical protein ACTH3E_09025 [Psychroflexus halocasei]
MITKTTLKACIDSFPEQLSIDELIEKLILVDKINKGNQQSENNKVLSEDELDKEMSKCF